MTDRSSTSAKKKSVTNEIIDRAEAHLAEVDPTPFSASAFNNLKGKISEYLRDLVTESIRLSKRHRADTVSAAHVEQASNHLIASGSRRFFRHLGTVGGVLLGAGLSTILAMIVSGQLSATGTGLASGLGIVGAFMIALHIAKD